MPRYFLEVAYKGTSLAGFQIQENAHTVQAELEKALYTYYRQPFSLTGSSRTDAGVHARQNFFHTDTELDLLAGDPVYRLNAILSPDVALRSIRLVADDAHCRFNASSREYRYYIYQKKNPFLYSTAWHYPYPVDLSLLNAAAKLLFNHTDFTSFSKRNTQVKTFECRILQSQWYWQDDLLIYHVQANRFLRGMVRALVATQLLVGRNKITLDEFVAIIESRDNTLADFSAPAHGLFLEQVNF